MSINVKRKPGRPATGTDPLVATRMPVELTAALDAAAAKAGLSRSELIRAWIQAHLGKSAGRDEFFRFGHWFSPALTDALFIRLDRFTKQDADPERRPVLSTDLRSEDEIDEAINELIYDLEQTRLAAKAALRRRLQMGAKVTADRSGTIAPAVAEKAARVRSKAASAADEALKGIEAPAEVKAARRKALTEKPAMVAKARAKRKS